MCSKIHVYTMLPKLRYDSFIIHLLRHLLLSFFLSLTLLDRLEYKGQKKAAHVKHFFILFTFTFTKKKMKKKRKNLL